MTRPLDGIRVLDFTRVLAGPHAARMLCDLGAEVIKIEPPAKPGAPVGAGGDPLRQWRLLKDGTSVWWQVQSRNKRSLALDLRTPEGQDVVRKLALEADVLIENFRPGAMEGWGLGPEALLALNPALVMLRISGYGQTGPYRDRPGFGVVGVTDGTGDLTGIITDRDLRRHLDGLMLHKAGEVMTANPRTIGPDALAGEALALMNDRKITCLLVTAPDTRRAIGILHVHDCLRAGVA